MQSLKVFLLGLVFVVSVLLVENSECEDAVFLKTSQSAPRIEKRSKNSNNNNNNNSDDFEKFFLKASKSVPRIGRRRSENDYPLPIRKPVKLPDIADLYEYNPDIFSSPQLIAEYLNYINSLKEFDSEDDDWKSWVRIKRPFDIDNENSSPELFEYRFQP